MRCVQTLLGIAVFAMGMAFVAPRVSAQESEHLQVGVYADYFRLSQTDTNSLGVGARLSFPILHRVKLEGEMAYDFSQAFTEGFNDTTNNGSVNFVRTNVRILHGEFGPKFELGHGRFHPFVFVKGGFANFNLSGAPVTGGTFASSVNNLRADNVNAVLYPGGGFQGHIGPVGLRLDVGDEIYFNDGAHHNLRMAFGPFLRF